MKKRRKLIISIMCFVFAFAAGVLAQTVAGENKVVYADAFISVEYKDTYVIGETLVVQSAEFDYQEKKYPANVLVCFPNGNAYRYDELVLTQAGEYKIAFFLRNTMGQYANLSNEVTRVNGYNILYTFKI